MQMAIAKAQDQQQQAVPKGGDRKSECVNHQPKKRILYTYNTEPSSNYESKFLGTHQKNRGVNIIYVGQTKSFNTSSFVPVLVILSFLFFGHCYCPLLPHQKKHKSLGAGPESWSKRWWARMPSWEGPFLCWNDRGRRLIFHQNHWMNLDDLLVKSQSEISTISVS